MDNLTRFDPADYLDSEELRALYLAEAGKERDPSSLKEALETVERAGRLSSLPPSPEEDHRLDMLRGGEHVDGLDGGD